MFSLLFNITKSLDFLSDNVYVKPPGNWLALLNNYGEAGGVASSGRFNEGAITDFSASCVVLGFSEAVSSVAGFPLLDY